MNSSQGIHIPMFLVLQCIYISILHDVCSSSFVLSISQVWRWIFVVLCQYWLLLTMYNVKYTRQGILKEEIKKENPFHFIQCYFIIALYIYEEGNTFYLCVYLFIFIFPLRLDSFLSVCKTNVIFTSSKQINMNRSLFLFVKVTEQQCAMQCVFSCKL